VSDPEDDPELFGEDGIVVPRQRVGHGVLADLVDYESAFPEGSW
jgi:hypothetical protein